MNKKNKDLIKVMLPFLLIPILLAGFYFYNTKLKIYVPPCPAWFFLHIYCPGCGGTRAVNALIHGKLLTAMRCNALVPAAIVIAFLYWCECIAELFGKEIKIIPRSRAFKVTAAGIAVAYIILRNFIPVIAPV